MTDFDVNALPNDDWETVVSAGIELAQHMDTSRWALGDLAGRVEKRYGTDALGNFATEIGMARKTTLKEYRRVSARFDPAIRMAFSEALSWSHFQAACVAGDEAEYWLAKAADDGLTVNALARAIKEAIGKPVPPVKVGEMMAYVSPKYEFDGAAFVHSLIAVEPMSTVYKVGNKTRELRGGQIVRVVIYEVAE